MMAKPNTPKPRKQKITPLDKVLNSWYGGDHSSPNKNTKSAKDFLNQILSQVDTGVELEAIQKAWKNSVNDSFILKQTEAYKFKRHILYIKVSDTTFRDVLEREHKAELLKRIKLQLKDIQVKNIYFELG